MTFMVKIMNILGIDPGSKNCGYGIISSINGKISLIDGGYIKINSKNLQEQILEFISGIDLILKGNRIDCVAIEDMFYAYNPKTVIKLAQFRGAISLKILQEFSKFFEYTPLQVKKALTGNGKASKMQVAFMVKKILNLSDDIKVLDITDALALAIAHAQMLRFYKA